MPPNIMASSVRRASRGGATLLQRPVSARLLQFEKLVPEEELWVEDENETWVLAVLVEQQNTILKVQRKDTGEVLQVDLGFGEAHPHNPKVVSDMTALHHIHEPSLLFNLGERAKLDNQRPYTFMGTILIAVNPLRRVKDPEMSNFTDRPLDPESPHPYAIAELAYHQMRLGAAREGANQSIVVSGESGAGKTETSKVILRFLTHRSVGGGVSGLAMEQKVVDSSPILESFGNAKTLRNNNSSRFGKYLKMQFTRGRYRLAGAFIETYLLQKSRVLTQGRGERNFHILYELIAGGAASGLAKELKLGKAETYRILNQSGCTTLEGVNDAAQFGSVQKGFETIGMGKGTQMQVWQTLAAVLHLSSLRFDKVDHAQGEIAAISDRAALATLSSLLGVGESALEAILTQRVVAMRGEVFTKQLDSQDADLTRDAIVKSLYEALFLWVVRLINTSLGKGEDSLPFIGVLDIFGFENFDTKNEFEQLLINFTNESLQDAFNKQIFNNELNLYIDEGIDVAVSTCPDNTQCLAMLISKPNGIIPSLDNVCAELKACDSRYLNGLHKLYGNHQDFPRTQPKEMRKCFWVKHYAGKVKYTVEGWVDRNMDSIPASFGETLQSSDNQVVRESAAKYGQVSTESGGIRPRHSKKSLVRPTVSKSFLASMRNLNKTLLETTCNFVRCIKPNATMQGGVYDSKYVADQLRCLGILQTCEVLKAGMPTRVTYTELKEVLGSQALEVEKLFEGEPETALISAILWAFEVPSEAFRLGKTRVFFRAGQISTLQKILNETPPEKTQWVVGRLQQALGNRQKAKATAEEASVSLTRMEKAWIRAEMATSSVLDPDSIFFSSSDSAAPNGNNNGSSSNKDNNCKTTTISSNGIYTNSNGNRDKDNDKGNDNSHGISNDSGNSNGNGIGNGNVIGNTSGNGNIINLKNSSGSREGSTKPTTPSPSPTVTSPPPPPATSSPSTTTVAVAAATATTAAISPEDLYPLVAAEKKARAAGSAAPHVEILLQAVDEDEIGTYAKGAKKRVVAASKATVADISASKAMADKLEGDIQTVRSGDETAALRRLEECLLSLKNAFTEAKGLAQGAHEAAAKCQVHKTQKVVLSVTARTASFERQALALVEEAKAAGQASHRQQQAFRKAKATMSEALTTAKKARAAFSGFKTLVEAAWEEEETARDEAEAKMADELAKAQSEEQRLRKQMEMMMMIAQAKAEAESDQEKKRVEQQQKKAAAAAAAAAATLDASASTGTSTGTFVAAFAAASTTTDAASTGTSTATSAATSAATAAASTTTSAATAAAGDDGGSLGFGFVTEENISSSRQRSAAAAAKAKKTGAKKPSASASAAPATRTRSLLKEGSKSIKKLLTSKRVLSPQASPTHIPQRNESDVSLNNVATRSGPGSPTPAEDSALEEGVGGNGHQEGYLMKQVRDERTRASRWQPYYFRLDGAFLAHYDQKSLVEARESEMLELTSRSSTGFTSSKSCFYVRAGQTSWFLVAQNSESMKKWMATINAQIYELFLKNFTPPDDDYWEQGELGCFFYGMPETGSPQWIYTHPVDGAPRTGQGIFPSAIIEVTQLLPVGDRLYLRHADGRGWALAKSSEDTDPCLVEVEGEVVKDSLVYWIAKKSGTVTRVLSGPSMASEPTGQVLVEGDRVQAVCRFTPARQDMGLTFIKMAEGQGWVPYKRGRDPRW